MKNAECLKSYVNHLCKYMYMLLIKLHCTSYRRYVPDPKMDENFHMKSSTFGCLFSPISNHPNLDDYCLSFSIVADVIYNHPILDDNSSV